MSIYTVLASMGIEIDGEIVDIQEMGEYGTFDDAMRACVEFWNTSDAIHPDIGSWVESSKGDTKYYPEDYCLQDGVLVIGRTNDSQEAEDHAEFLAMSYGAPF